MSYEPFNKETASVTDRIAWALCQIVDDDAPLRWTRYRFAAECIAKNPEVMNDLRELSGASPPPVAGVPQGEVGRMDAIVAAYNTWPADLRAKLSMHDLRRMTGWTPAPPEGDGNG